MGGFIEMSKIKHKPLYFQSGPPENEKLQNVLLRQVYWVVVVAQRQSWRIYSNLENGPLLTKLTHCTIAREVVARI